MSDELSDNLKRLLEKAKELFNEEGFNEINIEVLSYRESTDEHFKTIELKIKAREHYKLKMENTFP